MLNTSPMSIHDIKAIDVHAHYGTVDFRDNELHNRCSSADAPTVLQRSLDSNIQYTIVSPVWGLARSCDAVAANEEAAGIVAETEGMLQWVIIDPRIKETYEQAERMLQLPKCVGIKVHPESHHYYMVDHARAIFEFAARRQAIVLTHSGCLHSLPEEMIPFANDFPEMTLILAHIGNGYDEDHTHQARAIQASKHGNVYADSSSAQNIIPGVLEWTVKETGAERILFGTDTPVYSVPMQRARVDHAEFSDQEKRIILRDNAMKLFGLE